MIGTTIRSIRLPIIKAGDNVKEIIKNQLAELVTKEHVSFKDNDIIGITESLIARAYNNYVTVDEVADEIKHIFGKDATICVFYPIYSRNRFSLILSAVARAAKKVIVHLYSNTDEVGNEINNIWTKVNIIDYYRNVIESEGAESVILQSSKYYDGFNMSNGNVIVSTIHNREHYYKLFKSYQNWNEHLYPNSIIIKLSDLCRTSLFVSKETGYNNEFGLLGSNKCGDEKLKLFPTKSSCKEVCEYLKNWIKETTNKDAHIMVYGDGCFKDPVSGIWEFADPISCPYHTGELLDKSPNEIKLKYIADTFTNDSEQIKNWIRDKNSIIKDNPMASQGTTPRKYYDLLASLCDLVSGSGDKGTPVIWIQDYFKNYSDV